MGGEPAASSSSSTVDQMLWLLRSDDPDSRLEAAREIRRLTKTSQRYRRHFSAAVEPLVEMLCFENYAEAALAALLNLAVKDEANKVKIIRSGALKPIISFLKSEKSSLQESSVASLITLSASHLNKPTIASSGAIPQLVNILDSGRPQSKHDSVMALYNLCESISPILHSNPIPPLINLLKSCKRSSRTAEKCSALIESLVRFEEGRKVMTSVEGGILCVVEVLEGGTLRGREHALGALLTMCESDRERYREPILGEGVIPGLLQLTVQGTVEAQEKARKLLMLLRETPYSVCDITCRIDGEEQMEMGKAKRMVSEMVQVSMEQTLKHLQQRASAGLYTT